MVIGNHTRIKLVKNKVAPPFKQCEFDMLYDEEFPREGELIDLGVKHEVVQRAGAWYSFGDTRIGQGRDNARIFLKENTDIAETIESQIREKVGFVMKVEETVE